MRLYVNQPVRQRSRSKTEKEKEKYRKLRKTVSELQECQVQNKIITDALRSENESLRRAIVMEREDYSRKVKLVEERALLKGANEMASANLNRESKTFPNDIRAGISCTHIRDGPC